MSTVITLSTIRGRALKIHIKRQIVKLSCDDEVIHFHRNELKDISKLLHALDDYMNPEDDDGF